MIQQKVNVSIVQTVRFNNEKAGKIREAEARFANGVFNSLSFYISDEVHRFYNLESLKEVIELFQKIIAFSEDNKEGVEKKIKNGTDRLLRPE